MPPTANPYDGLVGSLAPDQLALLERSVAARRCREEVGCADFDELADLYRPSPPCPACGAPSVRDGRTPAGHRRHRCAACGRRFSALSGTVFEGTKKDLATWVEFIRLMTWNVPVEAAAEACGITHKTAWEWRHRVLATVSGYQDRIVLRDRVWIDEIYLNDAELSKGPGQARKRGLSKQKVCVCVAIDVHKNPVAKVCGHGKPSTRRVREALGGHLAAGSTVVHDRERAHEGLIADSGCASEPHKADCRDPEYLEAMEMVNSLCSWLKRYLWRFTGMSMGNLQLYLDWYVYLFRVRRDEGKWPKLARVVRHMALASATFRSS